MSALLEVRDVRKSFGGLQALDGLLVRGGGGSVTGLIGPNGSGKTTMFNVITGYERPDAGVVRFGGVDVTGAAPGRICAQGLGRTFQLTRVFPRLTLLENIQVGSRGDRAVPAQGAVQPTSAAASCWTSSGLTRLAHEQAGSLSYGQRKLVELAMVLAQDPKVDPARRACRRHQPDAHRPDGRAHPGAEPAGRHLPGGRAQHGVRHGDLRCGRRDGAGRGHRLRRTRSRSATIPGCSMPTSAARSTTSTTPARRHSDRPSTGAAGDRGGRSMTRLLELRGVWAGYGGSDVLRDLSFSVPDRQHHLRRRAQRRRQVDDPPGRQRPAQSPARQRHLRRQGDRAARIPARSWVSVSCRWPRTTRCSRTCPCARTSRWADSCCATGPRSAAG